MEPIHQPVLLEALVKRLAVQPGDVYLDLTAGYGGHAAAINQTVTEGHMVLVDRDQTAVEALKARFKQASVLHTNFYEAASELLQKGFRADVILMDLGLSSAQLANEKRGFSFRLDGPLDMRMDQRQELSAQTIINHMSEKDLAELIEMNSGERQAGRIAHAIVARRPFRSTKQLADTVHSVAKGSKIDPATRTFQALRIAVNDELTLIEQTLPLTNQLLKPGGRLAIISFHSLEDKLVKKFLRGQKSQLKPLTKKPIMGRVEDNQNKRARSAILRIVTKR